MGLEMAAVGSWGYGLAATAYAVFLLYLYSAWRGGLPGAMLLIAALCSALWGAANLAWIAAPGLLTAQLAGFSDALRNGGWLIFLIVLLRPLQGKTPGWLVVTVVVILMGQILTAALATAELLPSFPSVRVLLVFFLASAVLGLVLVEQVLRSLPSDSRWALKPACLGLAGGFIFELYLFADGFLFGRLDTDVWAVRGVVHTMIIPLVALSAARTPSWSVRISVSREMAFHSTALALSGLYLVAIAAAGYYVRYAGGQWGRALQLTLLFGGLLLLGVFLFSGAQRARLRVFLNKHLFPYRYDYRNEWLRFTEALSTAGDPMDLGQSVIKALADLVESSGGVLWLRDANDRFAAHAHLNHAPSNAVESAESPFCRFIEEHDWIVNLEATRAAPGAAESPQIPGWLSELPDAWLVVPLKAAGVLVGFVVLGSARTRFDVNWEVLDLLKTAQQQAASYLARMQATEALIESRKFDSFNRMSAFVVHDLKNLVAQLSLMLRNAERHKTNPAFQEDMIETVAHVESRMRALMMQLQEKRAIESRRYVDVVRLVERIRVSKRHQLPAVALDIELQGAQEVYAHPERLERVIGHLVQNALDATPQGGKVTVRIDKTSSGTVRIAVIDTGCGMSAKFVRDRLFKPFQSSKSSGMGIGAFETQQYVHELGGTLNVESQEGVGTTVSVELPLVRRVRDSAVAPGRSLEGPYREDESAGDGGVDDENDREAADATYR